MSLKRKTSLFIVITVVLFGLSWLIYDIYALSEGGTLASISHTIFEWSYKFPVFTWSFGFVTGVFVGHFFWRIRDTKITKQISDESRK